MSSSVANAAAFNPKGTKTYLANGLSKFPIKNKPIFLKVQEIYLQILLAESF